MSKDSKKPFDGRPEMNRASRQRTQCCRCGQQLDVCVRSHCPRCGRTLNRG